MFHMCTSDGDIVNGSFCFNQSINNRLVSNLPWSFMYRSVLGVSFEVDNSCKWEEFISTGPC